MAEHDDELVYVREVRGEIIPRQIFYDEGFVSIIDSRIICVLEDYREFYLERVPPDIIISLRRIDGEPIDDDRERFIDILMSMPEVIDLLSKSLKRVVIDHLDEKTGVYSATAEFGDGDIVVKRKMIPSHAIFLARLANKPIYVKKKLVEQQESVYRDLFVDETNPHEDEEDLDDEI